MTEPTYKPTEPEGTLDDAIAYATEWIETPGDEETVNWLRKLQADNAAFSARNVALELEIRKVQRQRERLRESLGLLASPLKLQPILREHIDALLKETAE